MTQQEQYLRDICNSTADITRMLEHDITVYAEDYTQTVLDFATKVCMYDTRKATTTKLIQDFQDEKNVTKDIMVKGTTKTLHET